MFARFKTPEGTEININTQNVDSFSPDGEGTRIVMTSGNEYRVQGTNRATRHAVKKAQGSTDTVNEAAEG